MGIFSAQFLTHIYNYYLQLSNIEVPGKIPALLWNRMLLMVGGRGPFGVPVFVSLAKSKIYFNLENNIDTFII